MKTQASHPARSLASTVASQVRSPALPDVAPRRWTCRLNRLLDVSVALAMLAVLAVPMLLVAVLVKLTSRGPALYRQQRVGRGGRPFTIYKFRTMGIDAEVATGPIWARHGDPRCTVVGHVLRRWCIDELPQLFNVLRGEMSLVGPRPERPYFVKEFNERYPHYAQRHQVLPGMTGWAQVNGWRGDTSLEKRIEFDLDYVRNVSIWLNLKIILLTPARLFFDRQGD